MNNRVFYKRADEEDMQIAEADSLLIKDFSGFSELRSRLTVVHKSVQKWGSLYVAAARGGFE